MNITDIEHVINEILKYKKIIVDDDGHMHNVVDINDIDKAKNILMEELNGKFKS